MNKSGPRYPPPLKSVPLTLASNSAKDSTLATFAHHVHIVLSQLFPQTSLPGISNLGNRSSLPSTLCTVSLSLISPLRTTLRRATVMFAHHMDHELGPGEEGDGDLTMLDCPLSFFDILLDTNVLHSECTPSCGLLDCTGTEWPPTLVCAVINRRTDGCSSNNESGHRQLDQIGCGDATTIRCILTATPPIGHIPCVIEAAPHAGRLSVCLTMRKHR
ncbi:hypothetical protein FRC08_009339 [Ceratobasidium sp. 394]|nr:hypothetical protein FRC08_009339 [Ceratobasidium sp. 394]